MSVSKASMKVPSSVWRFAIGSSTSVHSGVHGLESVAGKVSQLAAYEYLTGNPNFIADDIARYENVTAEDVMREILRQSRPEDGVWGEEYGRVDGSSGRLWVPNPFR